jgi:hypothetical protein
MHPNIAVSPTGHCRAFQGCFSGLSIQAAAGKLGSGAFPISAGIGVKSAARIGVGNRLHQFAHLGFQIIVGNDQGADRGSHIPAAGRDRLIHDGFEPVIFLCSGLGR